MRTRAQLSRDAALRRLTRVNRSLAVAALLGTAVITDVVANTASGHTRTGSDASRTAAGYKPALLVSGGSGTRARQRGTAARSSARSSETATRTTSTNSTTRAKREARPSTQTQTQVAQQAPAQTPAAPQPAPAPQAQAPAQPVVAVSGGS